MGASSATFTLEMAETCKPTGSVLDAEARPMEDFIEQMIGGMLGKELIPMRVGSGSAKRWVVPLCGQCLWHVTEDVALARVARDLLIFLYSHNINGPEGQGGCSDLRSCDIEGQ